MRTSIFLMPRSSNSAFSVLCTTDCHKTTGTNWILASCHSCARRISMKIHTISHYNRMNSSFWKKNTMPYTLHFPQSTLKATSLCQCTCVNVPLCCLFLVQGLFFITIKRLVYLVKVNSQPTEFQSASAHGDAPVQWELAEEGQNFSSIIFSRQRRQKELFTQGASPWSSITKATHSKKSEVTLSLPRQS